MADEPRGSAPDRQALAVEETPRRGGRWLWLLPAVTFLVGLLLGGLLAGLGGDGEDAAPADSAAPAAGDPAPEPSPTPSDLLVRVPEPCLAVAEEAEEAFTVFDAAVDAARELDARRLAEVVDEVQRLRPRVQELADGCRARAGRDLVSGTAVSPAPSPAGTPSAGPGASPSPGPAVAPSPSPTG